MNHPAFSPHVASATMAGSSNAASVPLSSQPNRRNPSPLPAFSAYGIELEYMIVERDSLAVLPIADRLLQVGAGEPASDVERGLLGWSNELALHVLEIKNRAPSASLQTLIQPLRNEVRYINRMLELYGAMLMPTAMHPWMDPRRETRLWPHQHAPLYQAYARIFDCNTHGWANLQSMHVNLPFADDAEFARLHAAVRLLLPVLPALAASSPFADGTDTGFADFRMHVYCGNAEPFSAIAGRVIPETVCSRAQYEEEILAPMYRELAPHDSEGLLRHEWLNSRGAIARFDRNAIEIRVIDTQECPHADLAVAAATLGVIRMLVETGRFGHGLRNQQRIDTEALAAVLADCIRDAEQAQITDAAYLALLGYAGRRCSAQQLWRHLIEQLRQRGELAESWRPPLQIMLEQGPLARRMLRAAGGSPHARLPGIYRRLCRCLHEGRMFESA